MTIIFKMIYKAALKLAPLPASKLGMKQAFLEQARTEKYRNYRSPWIPVTDANRARLQKGDLIINAAGLEDVHGEPRPLSLVENGETKRQIAHERLRQPRLVWVGSREEQGSHLSNNPLRGVYENYSHEVAHVLRVSASLNLELVRDVVFPVFHETSLKHARNLLKNGIDYAEVWGRWNQQGYCFYAARDLKNTYGRGMQTEAIVEVSAVPGRRARWVDFSGAYWATNIYNFIQADPANLDRDNILPMLSRGAGGATIYWLSSLCAELGASSLGDDRNVFIFDSFEAYKPTKIISR